MSAAMPRELAAILDRTAAIDPLHEAGDVRVETTWMTTRDGVRLATDLYLPPTSTAPTILVRTPYGRAKGPISGYLDLARSGYAVVVQDVRGTGDSEPDSWDFAIFEVEDGLDAVDWILRQRWYDGFIGGSGASYVALTQWAAARHPRMTAICPEVGNPGSGGNHGIRLHMMVNAYSRSVGRGEDKVPIAVPELERLILDETLATGYFDGPLAPALPEAVLERYPYLRRLSPREARRHLWEICVALDPAGRAALLRHATGHPAVSYSDTLGLTPYFPDGTSMQALSYGDLDLVDMYRDVHAAPLIVTGWYDWGLHQAFETWEAIQRLAPAHVRENARLIVSPTAHNMPGYHEDGGSGAPPPFVHRATEDIGLLVHWTRAVREDAVANRFPAVSYYLTGANEWRADVAWPPPGARSRELYLAAGGALTDVAPAGSADPDRYRYDPADPPPTLGGSIISSVLTPGSVDVSSIHARSDVLDYATDLLAADLDVVGPLRFTLHAGSSAADTDFFVRLSDVLPDGTAIQLQSGAVRCRYRDSSRDAEPLDPDAVYEFDIDLAGVAHRFAAGHRIRVDVCSADFPKFERNANRAGADGPPVVADQRVYRDAAHPSRLRFSVLE
jgi:predicted acyl esterase